MKVIIFLVVSSLTSSAFAACITPGSSAEEKKTMGAVMSRIAGGVSSWTEVKKGTNIKETKNTIVMNIGFVDPFKSSFRVGKKSQKMSQICESGGAVTITTPKGNATLRRAGGGALAVETFIGTYYVLPTSKVRVQEAEAIPKTPSYEQQHQQIDTPVIG